MRMLNCPGHIISAFIPGDVIDLVNVVFFFFNSFKCTTEILKAPLYVRQGTVFLL